MSDEREDPREDEDEGTKIARKAARMQRLRGRPQRSALYGLGMFGLVGWAIALPTVLGALLGHWIDARAASGRSWTLALMLAGAALGCVNAWRWVKREEEGDD